MILTLDTDIWIHHYENEIGFYIIFNKIGSEYSDTGKLDADYYSVTDHTNYIGYHKSSKIVRWSGPHYDYKQYYEFILKQIFTKEM